nr:YraN family protein [Muribaculaceae bacterium]
MNTTEIGKRGEQLAADFLAGKGYAIVGRNMVIARREVDILAMHGNRIVVVEVKTRKDDHPDDNFAIDRDKLWRLSRAADIYIRTNNLPHEAQIDAITIVFHQD